MVFHRSEVLIDAWRHAAEAHFINTNWHELGITFFFCVLDPLSLEYLMVFEEVCRVYRAWCVDQKAFEGRVIHRRLSCLCCLQNCDGLNFARSLNTRQVLPADPAPERVARDGAHTMASPHSNAFPSGLSRP